MTPVEVQIPMWPMNGKSHLRTETESFGIHAHTCMTRLTNSVNVQTTAETLKVVFSTISDNSNHFIASTSLHITRKIIRHYHTTYQKQILNLLQTSKKTYFQTRRALTTMAITLMAFALHFLDQMDPLN